MLILEKEHQPAGLQDGHWCRANALRALMLMLLALVCNGCGKDPAMAAIESDAYGFQCMKCEAKFFTDRKSPLGSKCPKCGQDSVEDAVGYWCEKDQHLTIRPRVSGPAGASVCEKCGADLKNAMMSPREKDLKAWGATRAGS
jgi:hypothetical protein